MEDDEITRIRSIPLAQVLKALGAERDPKDPTRNWRVGASRLTVTDSRFYDHNAAGAAHRMRSGTPGGGGAIDLVQYLKDVDFKAALKELGALPPASAQFPPARSSAEAPPLDRRPDPKPSLKYEQQVRDYLTATRAIPKQLVDETLAGGQAFADDKGNLVFRLRDETGREVGYEVRGTRGRSYHSVHGEKGLYIHKAGAATRAVFVESGIEALSYHALGREGLVISTTGNAVERPARLALALLDRGYAVIAAFNADAAGKRMGESLAERLGAPVLREQPSHAQAKDWNDQLRFERAEPSREFSSVER